MAGTPKIVMLIRHGEKPGDPTSEVASEPDLSVRGAARAAALPSLFLPATRGLQCALKVESEKNFGGAYSAVSEAGAPPRFPTPDFLFATHHSSSSNRPQQTITPTAAALGLSINDDYHNNDDGINGLAEILKTAPYAGKIVLICWHHGTIDALAAKLGGTGATKWKGAVFDRVWRIDYEGGSAIQQFGQQLLFGDETSVPHVPW